MAVTTNTNKTTTATKPDTKKRLDVGAFWVKPGPTEDFLSGYVEIDGKRTDVVAFLNTYKKEGEKTPDWRIYKSEKQVAKPLPKVKRPAPTPENNNVDSNGYSEDITV